MKTITALIYIVTCSVVSVISDRSIITTKDFKWIVKSRNKICSEPCGDGFRNVTYQCIEYDDPSGETKEAYEEDCENVPLPPPMIPCNNQDCPKAKGTRKRRRAEERKRFEWLFTGQWSHCINGCFRGKKCQLDQCFDNNRNEWVADSFCKGVKRRRPICSVCRDMMTCPAMWSTSGWSTCSKTCGRGTRVRTINCVRHLDENNVVRLHPSQCKTDDVPHRMELCAVHRCQPEFVASKWTTCEGATSENCGKGTRNRNVICAGLNAEGKFHKYPRRECFLIHGRDKFPKMWEVCQDFTVELSEECKKRQGSSKVFIYSNNATVIQMRRSRRMMLQVGETAYVFPRTNIVIKCPVDGFDSRDLLWQHNSRLVRSSRRVGMNFRGRLKIKKLRNRDLGTWRCMAKNESAALTLKMRHPSQGFKEYAIRLPLLTADGGMVSDESTSNFARDTVRWVADAWSECSSTCGPEGAMYRKVRCERIKTDFYKVYKDSVCLKQKLPKPKEKKTCGGLKKCPEWSVRKEPGVCTDTCVGVGRAILKNKIYCAIGRQVLPKTSCNIKKKPIGLDYCNNTKCTPKWKVSDWSTCSRSCGGQGVIARHLQCVWDSSGEIAGGHCYKMKLPQPVVVKPCETPPCNLDCVDFGKRCPSLQLQMCRYKLYQRYCCLTCKQALTSRRKV